MRAQPQAPECARDNLNRVLNEAIEPVPCPTCGSFQPTVVKALRQQLGRRGRDYDPNKYASERIAIPASRAWRAACEANTVASYTRFMDVWPIYKWHAEQQIRELKYPPYLRKGMSALFW